MRFLPLFRRFDVVIISSKKDQNRPTQSWDNAWNVKGKIRQAWNPVAPSHFAMIEIGSEINNAFKEEKFPGPLGFAKTETNLEYALGIS